VWPPALPGEPFRKWKTGTVTGGNHAVFEIGAHGRLQVTSARLVASEITTGVVDRTIASMQRAMDLNRLPDQNFRGDMSWLGRLLASAMSWLTLFLCMIRS
jgi:hypothetical protein